MNSNSKTPFWLKVRKEYVIQNFDALLEYLQNFQYDMALPDPDYDSTVSSMGEIVEEMNSIMANTPMYQMPVFKLNEEIELDTELLLRLCAATLLANKKKGKISHNVLLTLINLVFIVNQNISDSDWRKLWYLAIAAIRCDKTIQYGFNWGDIKDPNSFHISLFTVKFAKTDFNQKYDGGSYYYENRGVMIIPPAGPVNLLPMLYADYNSVSTNPLIKLEDFIMLSLKNKDIGKSNTFENLYNTAKYVRTLFENISSVSKRILKEYEDDQAIPVRITHKVNNFVMEAETVDPDFTYIKGKMLVRSDGRFRVDESLIREHLKVGDIVLVRRYKGYEDFEFDLSPVLEEYYRELANDFCSETVYAVYDTFKNDTSIWISEEGIRISVHSSKTEDLDDEIAEEYYRAIEEGTPIPIHLYDKPNEKWNNFNIYGRPEKDSSKYYESVTPFTRRDADINFIEDFLDYCHDGHDYSDHKVNQPEIFDINGAKTLGRLLYYIAINSDLVPIEKLKYDMAAAGISYLVEDYSTLRYLYHKIEVLSNIVDFCHNRQLPGLKIMTRTEENVPVKNDFDIIDILSSYVNPAISNVVDRNEDKESAVQTRVKTLVEASNNLRGIIGDSELNNIKDAIAKALKADDEFDPILPDRTFYGKEGLTLEFKKSIVFPPTNRRRFTSEEADPEIQKWAILKAICGFLNSMNGGELLIGVNDSGFADGVEDDIRKLYSLNLISKPNMDKYCQYVQNIVDRAFCEYTGEKEHRDIVGLNVAYNPETNTEGKEILRIKVEPYKYGVVRFIDSVASIGLEQSYVRRSGRTLPLSSDTMLAEVMKYKLSDTGNEERNIIRISNAINDHKVVKLIGYNSYSGCRDRKIEPYKLMKDHDIVYGYDLDKREPRIYRLSRCKDVEIMSTSWINYKCDPQVEIDPFGMLIDPDKKFTVSLLLTDYANLLLKEEYHHDIQTEPVKIGEFTHRFRTELSSVKGVGRFCVGLIPEVRIEEGEPLKEYIKQKASELEKS